MIAPPSNDFGFGPEVPQGTPPAQTVGHFSATVTPPVKPALPDPIELGDKAREKAGMTLSQLTWTFPDGSRKHAKLTSSRWALYEAVRATAIPPPSTDDPGVALIIASSQRFITASILLWFCLHEPEAWETPRPNDVALAHDWPALLREVRRWADEAIPPSQLDASVLLANLLVDLTFCAIPVRRGSEDEPEDDDTQKKTHP
jgi:hypothetical protein